MCHAQEKRKKKERKKEKNTLQNLTPGGKAINFLLTKFSKFFFPLLALKQTSWNHKTETREVTCVSSLFYLTIQRTEVRNHRQRRSKRRNIGYLHFYKTRKKNKNNRREYIPIFLAQKKTGKEAIEAQQHRWLGFLTSNQKNGGGKRREGTEDRLAVRIYTHAWPQGFLCKHDNKAKNGPCYK